MPQPSRLTLADLYREAARLGIAYPLFRAVDEVESRGAGWFDDGSLAILYEPHVFDRLTAGKHRGQTVKIGAVHWPLSYAKWGTHKYGSWRVQHPKRLAARALDSVAEDASCSWGRYQVMGHHARALGWASTDAMVAEMEHDERAHLRAFVGYITTVEPRCLKALQQGNVPIFTRYYNGTGQIKVYAPRIVAAAERFARETPPPSPTADGASPLPPAFDVTPLPVRPMPLEPLPTPTLETLDLDALARLIRPVPTT